MKQRRSSRPGVSIRCCKAKCISDLGQVSGKSGRCCNGYFSTSRMLTKACPRVRLGNDRVAKVARKSVELPTPAAFFRSDHRWSAGGQRSRNGTISYELSAKSPAGSGVWDCLWKTIRQIFASIPGPLLHRAQWFCPSPDGTREILFAATASGFSSVTSRCLMDVALGFHHRK